ncbi:MAG: SH3 domain-containing protein [Desulfobacterium sp.]|jgi:SH3-like domain-containing protein|nr:SH3 domain-containing protein [Desulfobacterium sp.]
MLVGRFDKVSGKGFGEMYGKVMADLNLRQAIAAIFFLTLFLSMQGWFCQASWAEERLAITSKIANVRSGPGTNHETLWQVETYYPILIVEKKGSWYRFKDFEGDLGWVHNSLVGSIPSVITVKNSCNVRSGPDPGNPIVFTVERGVPFKVLNKKDNWLEVEHGDGDKGWIYRPLVW